MEYIPKIKFESNPVEWSHRGGWSYVLQSLRKLEVESGTLFVGAIEETISDEKSIDEPWIGFAHQVPQNNYKYYPDLERLVKDEHFLKSLPNCRGIFVLSKVVKEYLQEQLPNVPICEILYPQTPFPEKYMFDWNKFSNKVVFIGEYLRNYQPFFDLKVPEGYQKVLLKPNEVEFDNWYDINKEPINLQMNDSVQVIERRIEDEEYDEILSSSIVFLNLYDAPTNTTVVECLSRNTPLVINRLPGIEEYLGNEYPLFYDTLEEASAILGDKSKLMEGSQYLSCLPIKKELTEEKFLFNFTNSGIYRSLPTPTQVQLFPKFDVTVVICCYKRTNELQHQLDCLTKQDYSGTFDVIIWNNNFETHDKVANIVRPYKEKLNIRLIQSTENYYCIIRLAVASLIYSDLLLICDDDVVPYPGYISKFMSKYKECGERTVLCCRGHVFAQHVLNEEEPQKFWKDYEEMLFFDENKPDREVHFIHADNCLISKQLLLEASTYPLPSRDTALVDDYWLSFVLSHHLKVRLWKFQASDIFRSTKSAENEEIALFYNPKVENERVNFYVYHMRQGWPDSHPLDPYT